MSSRVESSEGSIGVNSTVLTPATLPFPLSSNPVLRPARMLARRDLILARYHGADVYIPPDEEVEIPLPVIPPIDVPLIPPVIDTLMDSIRVKPESGSVHQP